MVPLISMFPGQRPYAAPLSEVVVVCTLHLSRRAPSSRSEVQTPTASAASPDSDRRPGAAN